MHLIKKIKDINSLVKKAQHYDELYKVYKENKKLTGLKGKLFAKKHAEELEDFHKTANYLQKAVKKYNLPGNANKTLELQSLLIKLRDEYNALVPEHNAFLLKKETASKYTRKVRSYLADEHNKREREQSIKRSQNHRRNGFSLE